MRHVDITAEFEQHRQHLFGVAYRMLGSVSEAEDVLQNAWLRWQSAETDGLANARGFLTTVVTRLCLDELSSAHARRVTYVGPWLPEPLISAEDDPLVAVERAESLSTAFLVLLESLSPLERAAFVLHAVFAYPYDEIAAMLDRTPAACRQLVSRAQRHVDARPRRFPTRGDEGRELVQRFAFACATGDLEAVLAVLSEDVVVLSDGGGAVHAARRPLVGAEAARFLLRVASMRTPTVTVAPVFVNGGWGIAVRDGESLRSVASFVMSDGRICAVHQVLNPAKLTHVG